MSSVHDEDHTDDALAWFDEFRTDLLIELADQTEKHVKTSLGGPGPQAPSKPGQPPNRQTDELYDNIRADIASDGESSSVESTRPSTPKVPEWLENGTPSGQMEARPYMGPAYDRTLNDFEKIVRRAAK